MNLNQGRSLPPSTDRQRHKEHHLGTNEENNQLQFENEDQLVNWGSAYGKWNNPTQNTVSSPTKYIKIQ